MKKPGSSIRKLQQSIAKSYGVSAASRPADSVPVDIIPTGSLALDYALGTGGWPTRHIHGIFGPRDVGKSVLALNAVANAQKMGMNVVWIAVEPGFDPEWAALHGVDVSEDSTLLILRPDTGEDAFAMLNEAIQTGEVGLVVFDSIGNVLSASETDAEGKPKVGGQSGLITWGVKRTASPAFKNNTCVLFLNQIRALMNSTIPGLLQQPGGYNIEHNESIIVQLKNGRDKVTIGNNDEKVQIGSAVVATVMRNKTAQGSKQRATYMFYNKEVTGYPFGIDSVLDTFSTGRRCGVITGSGWFTLPNGVKLHGQPKTLRYLREHPEACDEIRVLVLEYMRTHVELAPEEEDDDGTAWEQEAALDRA